MTRIEILQTKINNYQAQLKEIREERYKTVDNYNKNLTVHFSKVFNDLLTGGVFIECTSSAIYFKRRNEEDTYDKDLFNVYLRETYLNLQEVGQVRYKDIELSYYTTTCGEDFEYERLILLGKVAERVRGSKKEILRDVNMFAAEHDSALRHADFYRREDELERLIAVTKGQIRDLVKEEKKAKLLSEEGIKFEQARYVRLKFNFEPRISAIKLKDFNKSGTKATAVFTYALHDHTSEESNVDVERLLVQI